MCLCVLCVCTDLARVQYLLNMADPRTPRNTKRPKNDWNEPDLSVSLGQDLSNEANGTRTPESRTPGKRVICVCVAFVRVPGGGDDHA